MESLTKLAEPATGQREAAWRSSSMQARGRPLFLEGQLAGPLFFFFFFPSLLSKGVSWSTSLGLHAPITFSEGGGRGRGLGEAAATWPAEVLATEGAGSSPQGRAGGSIKSSREWQLRLEEGGEGCCWGRIVALDCAGMQMRAGAGEKEMPQEAGLQAACLPTHLFDSVQGEHRPRDDGSAQFSSGEGEREEKSLPLLSFSRFFFLPSVSLSRARARLLATTSDSPPCLEYSNTGTATAATGPSARKLDLIHFVKENSWKAVGRFSEF